MIGRSGAFVLVLILIVHLCLLAHDYGLQASANDPEKKPSGSSQTST
jgi:hypothetical protein